MSVLIHLIRGLFAAGEPQPQPARNVLDNPAAWQPLDSGAGHEGVTCGNMFSSPTGGRGTGGGWATPLANLPDPPADDFRGRGR